MFICREDVTNIMKDMPDGSFMVRDAARVKGYYTLTLRKGGVNRLIRIIQKDGLCGFAEPLEFESVVALVAYYRENSLAPYSPKLDIMLSNPISKKKFDGDDFIRMVGVCPFHPTSWPLSHPLTSSLSPLPPPLSWLLILSLPSSHLSLSLQPHPLPLSPNFSYPLPLSPNSLTPFPSLQTPQPVILSFPSFCLSSLQTPPLSSCLFNPPTSCYTVIGSFPCS